MSTSTNFKKETNYFIVSLIILILIPLLGFYVFAFGPPFGKLHANKEISKYTKTLYGNDVKIDISGYNLSSHTYDGTITNNKNKISINYNIYRNTIYDSALSVELRIKFERDFLAATKLFPQNFIFPTDGLVFPVVDVAGGYSSDRSKMKYIYKLYLMPIINSDPSVSGNAGKKELAQLVRKLFDKLSPNYRFSGMQVHYIDATGVYTIQYDNSNINKLYNNIENHILKSGNITLYDQKVIDSIKNNNY